MSRPRTPRTIAAHPVVPLFKPGGVRAASQLRLGADEFEALRLADVEGLQQVEAARVMGVSRQTFGRVLASGRRTVARALVYGLALRIDAASTSAGAEARPGCASGCGSSADQCARCTQRLVQLRVKGERFRVMPLARAGGPGAVPA